MRGLGREKRELLLLDGTDPLEARRAARELARRAAARALTFEEAAKQYDAAHEAKWSNRRYAAQFLSSLRAYAFPIIGKMDVATIDTPSVLKVIEPIWNDKTVTADRVRARIENILDWAAVRGHRTGDNPARWKGHLGEVLPGRRAVAKPQHHAALPYQQIAQFMASLRARRGVAPRALEFLILTCSRTSEVTGAEWSEIDFANATWTIPQERMKGSKEHRVPLPPPTVQLLQELYREGGNDHIFVGNQSGAGLSGMAMTATLNRMGYAEFTIHGFRSTFSTWAHECTAHSNHVIEMSLAHTVGNAVERAYQRSDLFDKRRRLMQDWAAYCALPPAATGAEVVPLRRGAGE